MAVSARLWFHLLHGYRMVPSRTEPVSAHSHRGANLHEANFKLNTHANNARFDVSAETAGLRSRPLDASQTCRSGQLMVLMDAQRKKSMSNTASLLWIPANSWSQGGQLMVLMTHHHHHHGGGGSPLPC